MKDLFGLLWGKVAIGAVIALVIALATTILTKNATIREARRGEAGALKARDDALANLAQCRRNTTALEGGIASQNAAVEAARQAGERRQAELERVAQQARREADAANRRATSILQRRGTGNSCADAEALIRETLG